MRHKRFLLSAVLLLTFAVLVVGGATAAGLWLLGRYGAQARERLRALHRSIRSLLTRRGGQGKLSCKSIFSKTRGIHVSD